MAGHSAAALYIARSGIQKAVRRGDSALAKQCYDILYSSPEHFKWLLWRMPVLVFEDAWTMAIDYEHTQRAARDEKLAGDELRRHWLKFVMRLTVAEKNKDASSLWFLAVHGYKEYSEPEFACMKNLVRQVGADGIGTMPFKQVFELILGEAGGCTPDQYFACEALDRRRLSGGMKGDQWNALAAEVLIVFRDLKQYNVREMLAEQKKKFQGVNINACGPLPWYCADMHTRAGQRAKNAFLKRCKDDVITDGDRLDALWFTCCSAKLGEKVLPRYKTTGAPTPHDSVWQHEWERVVAGVDLKISREKMFSHWEKVEPEIRKLVEWSMSKDE